MNCEILQILYIKSNGEVLCNDDFGERISLGQIPVEGGVNMEALFHNDAYDTIRDSFTANRVPWPDICEHCAFLRRDEPQTDFLSRKHITKLQVEPSLLCNLKCLGCSNDIQIKNRKKPYLMAPETFEMILSDLKTRRYRLDSIEYCGQGEPLTHPRFADFVAIAREIYPAAWQRLITNGNFSYAKTLGSAKIDEIMVAGDGLYQESYSQYRVKGTVDKVLRFMEDAVLAKQQGLPVTVWKYILFEFNDSTEEVLAAQEKAAELGVDTLVFVVTHSEHRSERYTTETITDLPVIKENVATNAHPLFYDGAKKGLVEKSFAQSMVERLRKKCCARIDELLLMPGGVLHIRGWAASVHGVESVEVAINSQKLEKTRPTTLRPDVEKVHPHFTIQPMGFRMSVQLVEPPPGKMNLALKVTSRKNEEIRTFKMRCFFETADM